MRNVFMKALCVLVSALLIFGTFVYADAAQGGVFADNADNSDMTENTGNTDDKSDNSDDSNVGDDVGSGDDNDESDKTSEFSWTADLSALDGSEESVNVQTYETDDNEAEIMYGAKNVLRRDGNAGEAHVVYEVRYLTEFAAVSYHLASDVAYFSFELSADGESWHTAETEAIETVESGKWTKVEYSASGLENVRYIKVVWGEERNTGNWWNPYFGGLFANVGEAIPAKVVINTEPNLRIPMYDSVKYILSAEVLDRLELRFEDEITWSLIDSDDERLSLSSDGEIEIFADMTDGVVFTAKAEAACGLYAECEFVLCAPMPGDTDGDNVITQTDIEFICENYNKAVTDDNRLCDVDKNGVIDIIDLAFAARYCDFKN